MIVSRTCRRHGPLVHRRGFRPAAVEPGPGCRIDGADHRIGGGRPTAGRCSAASLSAAGRDGRRAAKRGTTWPYRAKLPARSPGSAGHPGEAAHMIDRRRFLATTAILALTARGGGAARAQEGGEGDFSRSVVLEQARALAAEPFAPPDPLPEALQNLGAQDFAAIKYRDERRLFVDPPTGFAVDLIHSGFIYGIPVQISVVEAGVARRIAFDPTLYAYGTVPAARSRRADRLRRVPRPDGAERAGHADAVRDLRRRQLLPGRRPRPGLRPLRPRPGHRHRRARGRGVPLLPRPLDRGALRRPHGRPLAARRTLRHRRLPLHHPPRRRDHDRRRGDDLRPPGDRPPRAGAVDLDVPLRRQGPDRARRLPAGSARLRTASPCGTAPTSGCGGRCTRRGCCRSAPSPIRGRAASG